MENFWSKSRRFEAIALYIFVMLVTTIFPGLVLDDIGDEAAKYLLDDDWAGQWTCNLMGPENLTLLETTAILSQVLDLPLGASDD